MSRKASGVAVGTGLLLTACATVPTGPSVMVLPGDGKNFEQFQTDDAVCRRWAAQQTGTTAEQAARERAVSGAAVGTVLGAAVGAAIGAAAGDPGIGAAVGAGSGLLGGTAVGAGQAAHVAGSVQSRYDVDYMQCMYAKGNQIPVARGTVPPYSSRLPEAATPPTPTDIPPPPPGRPPPPPPGPAR